MIYNDLEITLLAHNGAVIPFDIANVNPASLDLTLDNTIRLPRWYWRPGFRGLAWKFVIPAEAKRDYSKFVKLFEETSILFGEEQTFKNHILWPGDFALFSSHEITNVPTNMVSKLYAKSTTGRVGLEHSHAGYGDPGFSGTWTFELSNISSWPIPLQPGIRLMQITFETMIAEPDRDYSKTGRYHGQIGATAARSKADGV
jgi:deoxycytidine triphosphate deaminase